MNANKTITGSARKRFVARNAGFTLIELLVALVLLSLMFVLLIGGLQFGTRVWSGKEQARAHTSQALAVQDLLRRLLSEARPVMIQTDKTKPQQVFFVGTKHSIRFVAPMLQHLGMGGFYEVALYITKGDQAGNLEMSWRVFPQAGNEQRVVLLNDVGNLEFGFFGRPRKHEAAQWSVDWQDKQYLPELIRMHLDHERLDLVVAPVVQSMDLIILDPDAGEAE